MKAPVESIPVNTPLTIQDSALQELRLEIDDYSADAALSGAIRGYNDLLTAYTDRMNFPVYFHSHHTETV